MTVLEHAEHTRSLSCSDVAEMIPLVAEGLIDPDTDSAVYDHLAVCAACSEALHAHDMLTLTLSQGHEIQPVVQQNRVVHYHIPRSLALAAAAVFLACGTAAVSLTLQSSSNINETDTLATQEPETQILDVLQPQHGSDVPLIIIRHQDQTMVIPQDQIDSGTDNQHMNASMPVNIRY